jgi:hypothetical protein
MPNKPQSQASLKDQLYALIALANREGLYDAADYLRQRMEAQEKFLEHVKAQWALYDATHVAEQGDDSHIAKDNDNP